MDPAGGPLHAVKARFGLGFGLTVEWGGWVPLVGLRARVSLPRGSILPPCSVHPFAQPSPYHMGGRSGVGRAFWATHVVWGLGEGYTCV